MVEVESRVLSTSPSLKFSRLVTNQSTLFLVIREFQCIYYHCVAIDPMPLMAALAGANVVVGAGMIQQSLVISHEQLVIDDEINRMAFRVMEGFEVDEEHLGADVIARIGPGGNFLVDPHTLKFLRSERYAPSLLYRNSREAWEASGSKVLLARAKEKAIAILQEHQPEALPENEKEALDELVEDALKSLEG